MVQEDGKKQVLINCYDSITFVVTFLIETVGWYLQGFSRGSGFNNAFPELGVQKILGLRSSNLFCELPLWWLHQLVLSNSSIMRGKEAFLEPYICIWTCIFLDAYKNYSTHDHTYECLPTHTYLWTANSISDNYTTGDENYETCLQMWSLFW